MLRKSATPSVARMFDISESLKSGLASAQERLGDAERHVASANAGADDRSADAAMAETARAAIFNEALLNAIHARLAELKSVTKA